MNNDSAEPVVKKNKNEDNQRGSLWGAFIDYTSYHSPFICGKDSHSSRTNKFFGQKSNKNPQSPP